MYLKVTKYSKKFMSNFMKLICLCHEKLFPLLVFFSLLSFYLKFESNRPIVVYFLIFVLFHTKKHVNSYLLSDFKGVSIHE